MVDVHGGDHRHIGVDDVDRIQAPAQADFQHRQLQRGLLQQPQRGQRAEFEIGQRGIAARRLHRNERGHQLRFARLDTVDTHALVVAQQMRRSVGAHLPAGRPPNRFDEGHRGALAVGPANHDDVFGRRFNLQPRSNLAYALQAHGDVLRMLLLDVGEPVGECVGGGHCAT